ncbi:polymorphic toxin-type HINT domain-containing protein [Streptomyces sp. NPDC058274]|uniref:polymorphic toxin-type HINT domain-containing protein n=1 Tax=Streptomyces sp. NPDC058274 TaxID=3346416 RepID=UPI0036EA5A77
MSSFGPSTIVGSRWGQRVASVVGFALLAGAVTPVAFAADAGPLGQPKLTASPAAEVSPFTAQNSKKTTALVRKAEKADQDAAVRARADQQREVAWPTEGSAKIVLAAGETVKAAPGSLPVAVSAPRSGAAPRSLMVKVLGQEAADQLGIKGIALQVRGPNGGGKARLGLNYSEFAAAYGGDWAGRLQLVRLPSCALQEVSTAHCRTRTPLDFTNDRTAQSISAPLSLPADGAAVTLAVAAGTQSGAGDYKATPLSAASSWEAGGSSGSFTWSYPLRMPPAAAGPKPVMSIAYDSGSIDGQTASTNNQGTTIGTGFSLTASYVERKYGSCDDDGQSEKYDLCWKYDNASLVLNGKATELVKDDTTGTWRLENDDASTVTHSTGGDNGDDNGEYWTVTTGDGTKYVFGLNKLDGAGAGDRTDSVWTVPVFGDDEGEPGYSDGTNFSDRDKKQAWRWNLDYVEDTHGNAMSYWYTAEHNNYDKLGDDNTGTDYDRGGYLEEIRYGQRANALFSASPVASDKVTFTYAERCVVSGAGCDSLTKDTRDNWPDVPYDTICKDGDKCTGMTGPSFFIRKRLTGISTHAWDAAAATPGYKAVDAWSLKQKYLDPGDTGDSTDQSLWLDEIKHTGKRGTDLALDPVKFTHVMRPNRVDGASDNILPLNKPRLYTITSEAGAVTTVNYAGQECAAGQAKPKLDENTKRCYPVYWSPNGQKDPILDWFQKYPVTSVSTSDQTGGSEPVQDTYQYSGGGAWHYNDDPMTPANERTWSIWRGYSKVTHLAGVAGRTQSKTVTVYLRGMSGDRVLGADGKTPDPDKRSTVAVTGIKAAEVVDSDQYAGFARESVTYNGAAEVSGQISDPWSKRTATQHKSYADTEAYYVRTAATHSRTNITSKLNPVDRVRTVKTTYDDYGMAETIEDDGDDAVQRDETCTRTWYARNDDLGINSLTSRVRTVAKTCATADSALDLPSDWGRSGDIVTDTSAVYDNTEATTWSATQKPTKGDVTWTGRASRYGSDDAPAWQRTAGSTYDSLGRPVTASDANGLVTLVTDYVPTSSGPLTSSSAKNAEKHKTTTSVDFGTGAALTVTDPNMKITETEYDSLGRTTKVWLPNRSHSLGKTPNYIYDYKVSSSAMSWVSTGTLKGDGSGYNTAYAFYDSLLRSRQAQTPAPTGGRNVSLTLYDDRGLAVSTQADIWDANSEPSGTPVQPDGGQAPIQTDTVYDGAARPITQTTTSRDLSTADKKIVHSWVTDTSYTGDTIATSSVSGGQAAAVVTNALGQTTQRREYGSAKPTGTDYTTIDYTYTPGGQQKTITGPDQSQWSYDYDLFSRQVGATDPDKGKTTTHYDMLDRVDNTVDAESRTLLYGYDDLNRKTGLWQNSRTDPNKLAAWTFDTLAKGQSDTAVRYDDGVSGKAYTQKVTSYDSLYQVTGSQLTLPDKDPLVAAGVPKTLSASAMYNLDGTIKQTTEPAVGGLASETIQYTYNATGQQLKATGVTGYLQGALFSPQGDLRQLRLGTDGTDSAKLAYVTNDYEPGTRRLTRSYITDDVHGYMPQELKFSQDEAGNVTSIVDATTQGGTTKADYQCFVYDGHSRLTEAWTPKTPDCAGSGRTQSNIDGAAPYWSSYTYNDAGQRKTETQHASTGATTTNYTYGTTNGQPHPLTSTTGPKSNSYGYDKTGNTTSRPGPSGPQSLVWSSEGRLAATTDTKADTGYLYSADGDLLIRRAKGDGDTVLYLGSTEVRLTAKGTAASLSGTRYYTANGQTIAVRAATSGSSRLSFLAADHHGTSSVALDATAYAVTKRYTSPFGAERGQKATNWPDDKGFLGKPANVSTGLTHVGAREYDPGTGQFLSVDPVLAVDQVQSLNGYGYANNTPVTESDPTGLDPCGRLKCGHEGDNCSDPDIYCYNSKADGTADVTGVVPSSGGTASTSSTGTTGRAAAVNRLIDLGPKTDDQNTLLRYFYVYASGSTGTGDFWDTPVGEGDRLSMACYGRAGCQKAYSYLLDTGDTTGAKRIAATYCLDHAKRCATDASHEKLTSDLMQEALGLIALGAGGGKYGCKCFLAGTDVLMADGTTKDIEDVKLGDKVLATDPKTGVSKAREVTRLIRTDGDKYFNNLSVATHDGIRSLTATHEHPFWSPSEHQWIKAGDLRPGMTLLSDDGSTVVVTANHAFSRHARTYNLTVDDLHTYYVLAGQTPVLVHNSNGLCGPGARTASEAGISPNDAQRIQNAADKAGQPIIVVGSRANGSANPASDWDYILSGPSRSRHSQQNSLPRGTGDGEGSGRGRDFWQNYNPSRPDYAELDPSKPHVIFEPRRR